MNEQTTIEAGGLSAALVKAQAEMTAPRKDREVTVKMTTGGTYKFSYATMAGMIEADRPILARHGLGFVQFVQDGAMVTRIIHESGDYIDCPLPMPNLPNKPQEAGSIITYFKRYSYSAAFGRVADEEDDANIAEGNGYEAIPRNGKAINDGQWATLVQLCDASGVSADRLSKFFEIDNLKLLPAARYAEAEAKLRATITKNAEKQRQPERVQ